MLGQVTRCGEILPEVQRAPRAQAMRGVLRERAADAVRVTAVSHRARSAGTTGGISRKPDAASPSRGGGRPPGGPPQAHAPAARDGCRLAPELAVDRDVTPREAGLARRIL